MNRPQHGARVKVKATVKKCNDLYSGDSHLGPLKSDGGMPTVYVRTEKDIEGVYIGWRTLSEGHTRRDAFEFDVNSVAYETQYIPFRYFEAWLISPGPRRNIVRALPEDVEVIEMGEETE